MAVGLIEPAPSPKLEPQRDRWGRPLIVPPGATLARPYTRVTTIADTLDDRRALEKWFTRNVVIGMGLRPDLYALASSLSADDRNRLNEVAEAAQAAAQATSKANLGTALHRFTERLDDGESFQVPEPWTADLAAYMEATAGMQWLAIERLIVLDEYQIAGTPDRVAQLPDGRVIIADLKTGQDLKYSWRAIAVQLAIYAHGEAFYDPGTQRRYPLPEGIDQSTALVMHLPAGQGCCDLWEVDIEAGWEAFQLALKVRAWRNQKHLARLMEGRWAQPSAGYLTSALSFPAEASQSLPEPSGPPQAPEGAQVAPETLEKLRLKVERLDSEARARLVKMVKDATAAGVDFRPSVNGSERRYWLYRAAMAVAVTLESDEQVTRAAVELVTGHEPPSAPLGCLIGSLTVEQARLLGQLASDLLKGARAVVMNDHGADFPPIHTQTGA